MVKEVSGLIERILAQIQEQLVRNKAIKDRLEGDWSDKHEAHQLEAANLAINTCSNTTLFKPAATRFPDE